MNQTSIYLPLTFTGILKQKTKKIEKYLLAFGFCLSALDLLRRMIDINLNSSFNEIFQILDGDDYLFALETVAVISGPLFFPRDNYISLEGNNFTLNRFGYDKYTIDLREITAFEENNINLKKQVLTFQKKNGNLIEVPWFKLAPYHTTAQKKQISSLFFEINNRINDNKLDKCQN